MDDLTRIGVRIAAVATTVMVGWLVSVILTVLPNRDPASIPLWTLVAIGAAIFVALTIAATRDKPGSSTGLFAAFALCATFAGAVSIAVIMSQVNRGPGHSEGYILAIGLILGAHAALGMGWVADVTRRRSA